MLPGDEVTVNPVMVDPPVAPAVNGTDACPTDAVAVPIVGACGTVVAVTDDDAADALLVPVEFVAVTVYVYAVADCSPVITIGLEVPLAVNDPGDDVTVKLDSAPPVSVDLVKAIDADPLLNALDALTFVATTELGEPGATVD
jgi:hypothetical protein